MKVFSEDEQGFFTQLWSQICLAVLLVAWGLIQPYANYDLSLPHLLSLHGLTALTWLLSAVLVLSAARVTHTRSLYWLGLGAAGSTVLSGIAWLHFQLKFGYSSELTDEILWLWLLERVNLGLALCGFWYHLNHPQALTRARRFYGGLLIWVLTGLALALLVLSLDTPYPLVSTTILAQPLQLMAGMLLFVPLAGLISQFRNRFSRFGYFLVLSLIIAVCTQFTFIAFSRDILDNFAHNAMLLRLAGALASFIAISQWMLERWQQLQSQLDAAPPPVPEPIIPTDPATDPTQGYSTVSQQVLLSLMEDFHRAREQEAEAKQYAESIVENLPLMVFVKDAEELRFQRLNRAGEQMLGLPRNEFIGRNDYDFFSKEQADFFTDTDRRVMRGDSVLEIPEEPINTTQGLRWLRTRKIPVKNAQGRPLFLLGISEDITERRELEQRFTLLFNAAPNGLALLNDSASIVLTNDATGNLFGYLREDLINQSFSQLVPHAETLACIRANRPANLSNVTGKHKTGRDIPLDIALQPLPWRGGHYMLASIIDSTERQAFINELERANRTKSLFLANMSHELRTPMNSIIGFTEKLIKQAEELTPRHHDALVTVQRNAHHLLGLINDILDISKIEAGKMELELEPVDLRAFLEQEHTEYLLMARSKHLEFQLQLPDEPVIVETDRRKLRQICHNLMSNAVKYTEHGQISIKLSITGTTATNEDVTLQFCDTGIGIKDKDKKRLFREFGRADEVRKLKIPGTGLGLLITAQLVTLLGGRISFSSEYGKGSTFVVQLPRSRAQQHSDLFLS